MDALKAIANGHASKVFIPYEATAVLGALGGIQEVLKGVPGDGASNGGGSPNKGQGANSNMPGVLVSPTLPTAPTPATMPPSQAGM